jgi:DNA-binding CsgD family transcriptional regulator
VDLVAALSHPSWQVQRLLGLAERWIRRPGGASRRRPAVRTFRHLRDSEVDQLVVRYKAGSSVYELGKQYGINRQTVGKHLRQRGVDTRPPGLAPEDVGAAAGLYQRGWSLAQIADRFDTSANTVRSRLKDAGVTMRDTHGREHAAPGARP